MWLLFFWPKCLLGRKKSLVVLRSIRSFSGLPFFASQLCGHIWSSFSLKCLLGTDTTRQTRTNVGSRAFYSADERHRLNLLKCFLHPLLLEQCLVPRLHRRLRGSAPRFQASWVHEIVQHFAKLTRGNIGLNCGQSLRDIECAGSCSGRTLSRNGVQLRFHLLCKAAIFRIDVFFFSFEKSPQDTRKGSTVRAALCLGQGIQRGCQHTQLLQGDQHVVVEEHVGRCACQQILNGLWRNLTINGRRLQHIGDVHEISGRRRHRPMAKICIWQNEGTPAPLCGYDGPPLDSAQHFCNIERQSRQVEPGPFRHNAVDCLAENVAARHDAKDDCAQLFLQRVPLAAQRAHYLFHLLHAAVSRCRQ